ASQCVTARCRGHLSALDGSATLVGLSRRSSSVEKGDPIMARHPRVHLFLRPVALAACVSLLAAAALPSQAATPAAWRTLFPSAAAYPPGTHLPPAQTATRATALIDAATAAQVTRLGFVVGGLQDANLPHQAVASVTVLVFRSTHG